MDKKYAGSQSQWNRVCDRLGISSDMHRFSLRHQFSSYALDIAMHEADATWDGEGAPPSDEILYQFLSGWLERITLPKLVAD